MFHRTRNALVLLALTAVSGAASAQFVYSVQSVPDFDQKRTPASGVPGLPGDGGMYCAPTSVINWFAYFANRGITQPGGLAGPRLWQAQANYNHVTTNISVMGALMGTHPTNGTNGANGVYGATLYALAFTGGAVNVFRFSCTSGDCPTPYAMTVANDLGGFVAAAYGYYEETVPGIFTRTGGHVVSIVGAGSAGSSGPHFIKYRDPASDGYNSTQSTFTTHIADVTPTLAIFRSSANGTLLIDTRYRLNFGEAPKFLDGWYVLFPTVGLTAFNNGIQLIRPIRLFGSSHPEVQTFIIPAGLGSLRRLAVHPTYIDRVFFLTGPGPASSSAISQLNPFTGQSTPKITGADLRFMEFDRFGDLIVCDGRILSRYDMKVDPPALINSVTLSAIPRGMACDDSTSSIGLLLPAAGGPSFFTRLNRDLSPNANLLLPAGINPLGNISMAFHDGDLYLCGDGTPAFYQLRQNGAALQSISMGSLVPPANQPTGLNVSDAGHVLFSSGGLLREYELDPGNRWVPSPSSLFAGRPAGPQFFILRSRTNHDPALHEGPGYFDVANPEIAPGIPDCYANCDGSTTPPVLNVNDFVCFQQLFASGNIEANCDASTIPPILNVNDFVCFQQAFAQGCP